MPAFFMLWKILKYSDEKKLFLYFSFYMVKISHSNEVSFSDWIKSYILLSKALFLNSMIDDGINLLRILLDVFACIPIEDFKYLSEIYRINNISLTNMFVNFDSSLKYFSKYHVYEKSLGLFIMLGNLKKKNTSKEKIFFNKNYKNIFNGKTQDTNISDAISNDNNYNKTNTKRNSSAHHTNNSSSIKNDNINKKRRDNSSDVYHENAKKKNYSDNKEGINYTRNNEDDCIFENSYEKIIIEKIENNQKLKNTKSKSKLKNNKKNDDKKKFNENYSEKSDYEKNMYSKITMVSGRISTSKQDSKTTLNKVSANENSNNPNTESNTCNLTNLRDIGCDDYCKLQKYIDENINRVEIPTDSPCDFFIWFLN
jgi:hypothetical protein